MFNWLLRLIGIAPDPPPNMQEHDVVIHELERAAKIARRSWGTSGNGPTGNFVEDLSTGAFKESKR